MRRKHKRILWKLGILVIIIIILLIIFLPRQKEEVIKIGVLADLSGDYASFLRGIYRGTELAAEDLKNQGINIQLIIEDQKSCDTKETVTIMNKFVNVDKVNMIIGGSCSSTTLAAAPIAEQSKTIMISPSSSAPTVTDAGEYIFRTYISDLLRTKAAADLAYKLGKRRMAIITDINNDATVEGSKGAKERFLTLGGNIVAEESITKADSDFRSQIIKIKSANPDVVLVSITGPIQIVLFTKQLKELGGKYQLISPFEVIEDPKVIDTGGDTIEGLIYVMPGNPPNSPALEELKKKYYKKYKEDIPSFVAESYDAVFLGVKAILLSDKTKEDIKNKLFEVSQTYNGVSGNVTFDENGDVTKPVLLKQVKNREFVEYATSQ
jgi:branched-chain amino acid transport system substrate-binding protein